MTLSYRVSVTYAKVAVIGFDGPIDLQSLRLYLLPEAASAAPNGTPLLPQSGQLRPCHWWPGETCYCRADAGAEPYLLGPAKMAAQLSSDHARLGRLVADIGLERTLSSTMTHWTARRIGQIIRPEMDGRMGANIQGPSMIRVPDWMAGRLGRYYLYFADHKGAYIRLAYADVPQGPWRMHEAGSLDLRHSLFPTDPPTRPAEPTGTVDMLPGQAPAGTPGVLPPEVDAAQPHIASPDVHVDEANRRIVMYFHGLAAWGTQRSRVATSADGLAFAAQPELLGPSYFRVFRHGGATFALAMPGILLRSADGFSGFERGPMLFEGGLQRHTAVLLRGDMLHVFWTRVGDTPERIYASRIPLRGDWRGWRVEGEVQEVLRPEMPWEGSGLPLLPSWRGAVHLPVRQLRDPAIFEEDGRVYLLYAVQGEAGIAIGELSEVLAGTGRASQPV